MTTMTILDRLVWEVFKHLPESMVPKSLYIQPKHGCGIALRDQAVALRENLRTVLESNMSAAYHEEELLRDSAAALELYFTIDSLEGLLMALNRGISEREKAIATTVAAECIRRWYRYPIFDVEIYNTTPMRHTKKEITMIIKEM